MRKIKFKKLYFYIFIFLVVQSNFLMLYQLSDKLNQNIEKVAFVKSLHLEELLVHNQISCNKLSVDFARRSPYLKYYGDGLIIPKNVYKNGKCMFLIGFHAGTFHQESIYELFSGELVASTQSTGVDFGDFGDLESEKLKYNLESDWRLSEVNIQTHFREILGY